VGGEREGASFTGTGEEVSPAPSSAGRKDKHPITTRINIFIFIFYS
jgi:hypothetical protein